MDIELDRLMGSCGIGEISGLPFDPEGRHCYDCNESSLDCRCLKSNKLQKVSRFLSKKDWEFGINVLSLNHHQESVRELLKVIKDTGFKRVARAYNGNSGNNISLWVRVNSPVKVKRKKK